MRSMLLVLAATSLTLFIPRPADACSLPACVSGAFVPGDHGHVPANVPGLYWRPMFDYRAMPDPGNVVLTSTADPTTPIPITAKQLADRNFLLVPDAPLAPGSYVITDHTVCGAPAAAGPQAAFTVEPAAPMPSTLGALIAMPASLQQLDLATGLGTCSAQATVDQTSIELAPSDAAAAWFDALHFETWVDGKPWYYQTGFNFAVPPGQSPLGRARDRVFQVCSSMDPTVSGLAAGKHVVTMRATLPGSTLLVMSSPLEITLQCPKTAGDPTTNPPSTGGCSVGSGAGPGLYLSLLALSRAARRREHRARRPTA